MTQEPIVKILPPMEKQPGPGEDIFHSWILPDDRTWAEFYYCDDGFMVRFPDLADFLISADGREITACKLKGVSETTMSHLLYNQVIPLAWSHQGRHVLHASAVMVEGKAIAFLGHSGRGKSSLATIFATSGYPFLADDSLLLQETVDGFLVPPGQPTIRLWQDSLENLIQHIPTRRPNLDYTDKSCIIADNRIEHHTSEALLGVLFCLEQAGSGKVEIERIYGREAIFHLIQNSLVLDVRDTRSLQRNFSQLCALANRVPIFRLGFPHDYGMLNELQSAILGTLAESARAAP